MADENTASARLKIQKVFTYIRELTKLRTPPIAKTSDYSWSLRFSQLPKFPTIQTAPISDTNQDDLDGLVLKVGRPPETRCPPPPATLKDWIEKGWDHLNSDARHIHAKNMTDENGQTITEKFEDDPSRPLSYKIWTEKRDTWMVAEIPAREAAKFFTELFKLHGQLQRESEKFQLYLGDGNLIWESAIGPIDHPILLKKIELEFSPSIPEFILRETDDAPELYTTLLRHHELNGGAIMEAKTRLEADEPHPLANNRTVAFLKFFIQRFFQDGKFFESESEVLNGTPSIHRNPVVCGEIFVIDMA